MREAGVHYDTGNIRTARHRDSDCPQLRGRRVYRRVDSDTPDDFPQDLKWCRTCSPADHARSAAALSAFKAAHA